MNRKKNLETCLVIVTGLLIIYLIRSWYPLLIGAIVIGLISIFLNKPASWITWIWQGFADIMGKIVSKVILSIVFFVFLLPISILSRLLRKDRPELKTKNKNSMWINREYNYIKDDLIKPW